MGRRRQVVTFKDPAPSAIASCPGLAVFIRAAVSRPNICIEHAQAAGEDKASRIIPAQSFAALRIRPDTPQFAGIAGWFRV